MRICFAALVLLTACKGDREAALAHQARAYEDGASPLNYLSPFVRDLFSLDPDQRDRLRQMRLSL